MLELAAYAGYTFTAACASLLVQLVTGEGRVLSWVESVKLLHAVLPSTCCPSPCMPHACLNCHLTSNPPAPPADSSAAYHVMWAYGSLCMAVFLVRPSAAGLRAAGWW